MKFKLNQQQEAMRTFVRNFAVTEVTPAVASMEQGIFPRNVVMEMGKQGLMGIPLPKTYGGAGGDFVSYIIAIHELSKVSAALGVILSVHTSVGTNPIFHFGTTAQKTAYIPKLTSGEYLGAFALTEPQAGSDAAKLLLQAKRSGHDFLMNGSKMFITNGKEADIFITFARTNEQKGAKGISAFIVEKDTPGLSVGKEEPKMGLHGTSTVALHFDHCRIHQHQMLGEEGEGFKVAMYHLNAGRIGIAAQALGIAEGAYNYIVSAIKGRSKNSQDTLFQIAEMATKLEAATLLVYRASSLMDREIPCVREVSMAKLFATKTAREVTISAIDLLGWEAVSEDSPLQRYFRDAKVTEIYEGTSEIQRIVIAKQMLK